MENHNTPSSQLKRNEVIARFVLAVPVIKVSVRSDE